MTAKLIERYSAFSSFSVSNLTSLLLITEDQQDAKTQSRTGDSQIKSSTEELEKQLRLIGTLKGGGNPDADLVGLIENLDVVVGTHVESVVDHHSLAATGISLENIALPMEIDLTHASVRSSLRLILDQCGLGFYVDTKNRIVVTTYRIACMYWRDNLHVPAIEDLTSDSVDTRRDAVFAAGYLELDKALWEPALVAALSDADKSVRFDAATALGELGAQNDESLDALIATIGSEDPSRRCAATFALGKTGPKALNKLVEQAKRTESVAAVHSIRAIGFMGAAGNTAVEELIAIGSNYSEANGSWKMDYCEFCEEIADALAQIELGDAVLRLKELLKSEIPKVRAFAASCIGKIGAGGSVCEPDLQLLLKDSDVAVRINAAFALAHLNLGADTPTDALKAAALDSNQYVELWSKKALRIIESKQAERDSNHLRK